MAEETPKLRYSDEDLQEFKTLLLDELAKAKSQYEALCAKISHSDSNGTDDTAPSFNAMEEGAATLSKEEASQLAQRQYKYISNLEAALARVENKTYGICRVTGKLIPKERLRIVPIATMTIEAKENEKKSQQGN